VGGSGGKATELANEVYNLFVSNTTTVSSTKVAEAVKLTENIFRSVNIALVNELKIVFDQMDIDVWEVIEAAATKPFGYMPFYPGPGLGGHCIPIDPFYLTWKAHEFDVSTRFIELAGEINRSMPEYVVRSTSHALNNHSSKALNGARVLIVGVAYKKDIDDYRESPSLDVIELLHRRLAHVDYYDPFIASLDEEQTGKVTSVDWDVDTLKLYDIAVICTNHSNIDYEELARHIPLIIDTRNAMKDVQSEKAIIIKS
jgi:UDP-N-acetyl-D-glucosamine dehydrogenase